MKESPNTLACLLDDWLKDQNLDHFQVETERYTSFKELYENEKTNVEFQLSCDRKTNRLYMVKIPLSEYYRHIEEISRNSPSIAKLTISFFLYLAVIFGVGVFLLNMEENNPAIALWVMGVVILNFWLMARGNKKEKREELEREKRGLPKRVENPWFNATKIELNKEDYSFLISLQNNQKLFGDENYQLVCEAFYNAKTTGSEEALKAVISSVEKVKEKLETDSEQKKATN